MLKLKRIEKEAAPRSFIKFTVKKSLQKFCKKGLLKAGLLVYDSTEQTLTHTYTHVLVLIFTYTN